MLLNEGDFYSENFSYSMEDVKTFATISGDFNPIHIDEAYAANTVFKKPIVHGIFALSVFSKMIGMTFPGEGTVYMGQDVSFKRPVFVGKEYIAKVTISIVNRDRHTATIATEILDAETKKICVVGIASILHKEKI
ncbi:MAG: MaoC family dehydratase [Cytophagaceae bacterium]|nr:MaoC family dehydratase [Cytophagaceae bacterium]